MRKNEAQWIESRRRWQIKVQSDGVRRTFVDSTQGKKGKVAAEQKADKWLEEKLTSENTRVEILLDRYEEEVKKATSKAHYNQYRSLIKMWIKPHIGLKKIGKITNADLQSVINNAYDKNKLSEKTLKNIRACITSFMNYCIDCNATNIRLKTLKIPLSAKRSTKKILAPDDFNKLFESNMTTWRNKPCEDFYINAYRFSAITGLRPGELIGLTRDNIKGNKVTITKSINDLNEVTQGKNKNALRTFVIGPTAQSVLRAQELMLRSYGGISKYVFPNKFMEHIDQEDFRRCWKRYCTANKFQNTISPYELRHTFVSITDEMPETFKKPYVGHSKNMDTEGVYGHEKQGDMERAAGYVETAISRYIGTHKGTQYD